MQRINGKIFSILFLVAFGFMPLSSFSATIVQGNISSGLVGQWTFDDSDISGLTAYDRSGQGNDLTLTNIDTSTALVTGHDGHGKALALDGVNDNPFRSSSNGIYGLSNFSVSFWFKSASGDGSVLRFGDRRSNRNWSISVGGGEVGFSAGGTSSGANIQANQWYYIVVMYNSGKLKMYVNDNLVYNGTTGTVSYDSSLINFGSDYDSGYGPPQHGSYTAFTMDDFRIYNRALSALEVFLLYNLNSNSTSSLLKSKSGKISPSLNQTKYSSTINRGLQAYYSFDGVNMGTTIKDESGNGNVGTITPTIPGSPALIVTGTLTYDGAYSESGTNNGYPMYVRDSSHMIYCDNWNNWDMSSDLSYIYWQAAYAGSWCGDSVLNWWWGMNEYGNPSVVWGTGPDLPADIKSLGKFGQGIRLDGATKYVTLANSLVTSGARTISLWVKPTSFGSNKIVYNDLSTSNTAGEMQIMIDGSGYLHFFRRTGNSTDIDTLVTDTTIPTNKWTHVIAIYDGSLLKIYRNGILDATTSSSSTYTASAGANEKIGVNESNTGFFDGYLDDFRVYNRALSLAEILKLYNGNTSVVQSSKLSKVNNGLVGHWTFDGPDISGTTVYDKSEQGNNGNAVNVPIPSMGKLGQGLRFDISADNAVQVNGIDTSTTNFKAASYWIYPYSIGNGRGESVLATSHLTQTVEIQTAGDLGTLFPGNIKRQCSNPLVVNKWQFVYVDIINNKIYKNGIDCTANLSIGWGLDAYTGLYIGKAYYPAPDATLDDIRVYNRTLSDSEILKLYNLTK